MKPDRVVFNALITACAQAGAVDRAFDVLAEMSAETHPIDPDHITIGALMKACANANHVCVLFLFVLWRLLIDNAGEKCFVFRLIEQKKFTT